MMRSIHALGTVNGCGPLCTVPIFLGSQPCLFLVARRSSVVVCHQEKHASVVVSIVLGFHVQHPVETTFTRQHQSQRRSSLVFMRADTAFGQQTSVFERMVPPHRCTSDETWYRGRIPLQPRIIAC